MKFESKTQVTSMEKPLEVDGPDLNASESTTCATVHKFKLVI